MTVSQLLVKRGCVTGFILCLTSHCDFLVPATIIFDDWCVMQQE
jgi:hypothetical protein